jgi:hypothetical protein
MRSRASTISTRHQHAGSNARDLPRAHGSRPKIQCALRYNMGLRAPWSVNVPVPVPAAIPSRSSNLPMPFLLVPLLLIILVVAWLILLPLTLRQRYRYGRARRRAQGWMLGINAWVMLSSVPGLMVMAWLGTRWSADALRDAVLGLGIGAALGGLGLVLTRFEHIDGRLHYTPNRWLVLALTVLVALRIAMGVWLAWHRMTGDGSDGEAWVQLVDAGGLWGVGGVLLGYAAAYAWGLYRRHAAIVR